MTDGPCFIDPTNLRHGTSDSITFRFPSGVTVGQLPGEPEIDLTTFSQWLDLNPPTTATIAGMLELLGNALYRAGRFAEGSEVKHIATELRAHHDAD